SNTILRAIQTMLWFHPAIWRLVREAVNAREESCDIEAVRHTRNTIVLARALVRLEEHRQTFSAMIAASDGALTHRVRSLISGMPLYVDSHRRQSWTPLLASLVVLLAGEALAARLAPASERLALVGATANAVPAQRMVISAADPAGRFTLTLLNGRVAAATIAGVPVARPSIHRHQRSLSLTGAGGEAVVEMEFDPLGAIRWMPRAKSR
ncbi:MAG: hypothetical protein ABJE10_23810, partial [bacterium]